MWIYAFTVLMVVSLVVAISLCLYGWRYRATPGARAFIALTALSAVWIGTSLLSMLAPTPELAVFWWLKVRFVGVTLVPVAYLFFALEYTEHSQWLHWRRSWLFFVIPILTLLQIWGARDSVMTLDTVTYEPVTLVISVLDHAWFWVHTAYSYLLILGGMILLALRIVHAHYPYRQQAILMFAGSLVPFVVNMLLIFRLLPRDFPPLDLSALSVVIVGVTWGWALFRYQLLDIMPVARDAVLESMADGVIVVDTHNRIVDINPAAERIINLMRVTAVGKPLASYLVNQPEVWERFAAVSAATAEITLGAGEAERVFDLRISTLYRKHAPTGRLIVLRDITERQQAAEALQQYAQELEARNAELDAFAHTVAHDLKNPLSAVVGFTSLLIAQRDKVEEGQRLTMLNTIKRQGYRMARIIDELLLLASLRKLGEVAFSPLDMEQIVAEVQERLAAVIEEKQAHITLPETWPTPVGYAAWVEEILANYLSNALKYGGTPPHIVLGWDMRGEMLRFWVQDDGAGLTPEEQSRLFTPFTRLDQVSAKGHGLGLSIVRGISEKLDGEVGVESAPGQGSTFWFTLPVDKM